MKPILEIKHVSKKFRIAQGKQSYLSIRDAMSGLFSRRGSSKEDYLALNDVSYDVYPGDSVGIIGKNGAGKSTLLKVLSRITPPTSGKIITRGRIASLLEVGTGFHPELSGRENIYLNGSILGMKRSEINQKFDEIVDFSGVEKFLDTPLKHYSSGMQLRLAFAVAAFLEPEVLVIDEVLAVGDAEFQKKCMGKMESVSKSGRTILFVSHNMGAVAQLCNKGFLLNKGKLMFQGNVHDVLGEYLKTDVYNDAIVHFDSRNSSFYFDFIEILNAKGERVNNFSMGDDICVRFKYHNHVSYKKLQLCVVIKSMDGIPISYIVNDDSKFDVNQLKATENIIEVRFRDIRLYPNTYIISLIADELGAPPLATHLDCISFTIDNGGELTYRSLPKHTGTYFMTPEWTAAGSFNHEPRIASELTK
jgi:lipopolysaccharide transport system ATP-binding protein